MSWLLELLVDAIREMCSQFIVDMMELITNMFTELLSCNLSLFEELFSVVGSLYKNVIVPTGIAILLMILVWQLFKSMFGGKAGVNAEEPIELICRSAISLFLLAGSKPLVDYILRIAGTPYQWVVGTKVKVASFSGYVSTLEGVTDTLGISSLSISVLMLIMQFVVAWNYFKMLMVIAERYVLLGVFSYTAPLAFATGGSKATNNILASWSKMFGGQVVLVILNAWCMKMFLSGYGNMMASSYGFTKFFAATLCLVTGQTVTPQMTCAYSIANGEYVPGMGTSHSFPTNAAYHWGLTCERVGKDRMNYVVQSLKEGKMVVEICEAYTITGSGSGHFIVLTGVTRDGYITIADCASRERTGKVYSVETIKSYGRDLSEGAFWIVGKK